MSDDKRPKIIAAVVIAVLVAAVALIVIFVSSGSNGIPSGAVARAGNLSISDKAFDHWVAIAAKSQQQAQPDKDKKKKKPTVPKKGTQEYNQLRDQVMQFLINAAWIEQEASEKGVKVSQKDIDKEFEKTKKQFFPKKKDFKKFLKTSGMSEDDVMVRVKLQLLSNEIREKVTKEASNVSDKDIEKYYKKNKKDQFTTPETIDVKLVVTKTKAKAEAAKKALKAGDSWKSVAKKYSTDEASKNNGGKLNGVTKGQFGKKFDEEVFKDGKKGVIIGPFKTTLGWYVVEITKKTKKKTTALNKATKKQIKGILESQGQQEALQKFIEDFRENWKSDTECRKGYVVEECGNAPKPKTTAPAPGAPPQGGGAPPQGGGAPPPQGGGAPPPQGGGSAPPPSGGQ